MFSKLKRAFSAGGVKMTLTPPRTMGPSTTELPIGVTLVNRTDEERLVHDIAFALRAKANREDDGRNSPGVDYVHPLGLVLQPGERHELTFEMPTTSSQIAEAAGVQAPGWLQAVGSVVGAIDGRHGAKFGYVLRGAPRIEGFSSVREVAIELGKGHRFG